MPQSPEQFFAKKNSKEQTESFPETEKEALELVEKIREDLMNKSEITPEDYQRIIKLCKEIKRLFSPERNPIGIELIPNAEVEVGWVGVESIAFSPDGNFVVIVRISGEVRLAKIIKDNQGNPIRMELIPNVEVVVEGEVWRTAISPDGNFVVIVRRDGKTRLVRITKDSQGNPIGMELISNAEVEGGRGVWSIDISSDENFVVIGSFDDEKVRLARIIKDDQGNPIGIELIPNAEVVVGVWVESVAISPDGNFVVIGGADGKVRLAKIIKDNQGNPIGMELIPNTEVEVNGGLWRTAISPDGNFVVIGSVTGKVRLVKIIKDSQGNPIGMELISNAEVKVERRVEMVVISPDGNFVVITSEDGKVRLAKIIKDNQGNPIRMELIPDAVITVEGGVDSIAISPDGNSVVIGGADGKARLAEIIFEEQE